MKIKLLVGKNLFLIDTEKNECGVFGAIPAEINELFELPLNNRVGADRWRPCSLVVAGAQVGTDISTSLSETLWISSCGVQIPAPSVRNPGSKRIPGWKNVSGALNTVVYFPFYFFFFLLWDSINFPLLRELIYSRKISYLTCCVCHTANFLTLKYSRHGMWATC